MSEAPAVVLMARAPRRGAVRQALEPLLGLDGSLALHRWLLHHAAAWARDVAGDRVYVAFEPADAQGELAALLGPGAELFPQSGAGIAGRTAAAAALAFAQGARAVLIVWPDVPRLRGAYAHAALEDLRCGCGLVLGPEFDGGMYLIGLPEPRRELFAIPEASWRSPNIAAIAMASVGSAGIEVGVLRAERALRRPADVRAALSDPLLAPELASILRPHG